MAEDSLGNRISFASPTAVDGVDGFVSGFLGNKASVGDILGLAETERNSPLAQVYAAIVSMFAADGMAVSRARHWLDRARATINDATEREQMNFAMVEAWAANDIPSALAAGEQLVDTYPGDLVAVKLHQNFSFHRGDAPAMLRIARKALSAHPENPHLLGMLAFGYEECHFLGRAERTAWHALDIMQEEPWAHHALAHVMLTDGRVPEGADFLRVASKTWLGLNSFMYTHNWWHRALFQISLGDAEAVFEAYDAHCWAIDKSYAEDQIGAVSLLARMELAGFDVEGRWADLSAHLLVRKHDVLQPFQTMQYLYGLAKGGRDEAEELMRAIEERTASAQAFEKLAWTEVALPACRGLLAHARGQFELAVTELSRAMPRMMEIGGSHAQRDLFAQVLLDAHIRAGHLVTAQQLLESRRRFDPNGVPLNRMLASVYEKLGLLDEAAEAAERRYQ